MAWELDPPTSPTGTGVISLNVSGAGGHTVKIWWTDTGNSNVVGTTATLVGNHGTAYHVRVQVQGNVGGVLFPEAEGFIPVHMSSSGPFEGTFYCNNCGNPQQELFNLSSIPGNRVWMDRIIEYDTTKSHLDSWEEKEAPVFIDVYKVGTTVSGEISYQTVDVQGATMKCNRTLIRVRTNALQLRWNMVVGMKDGLPGIPDVEKDIYIEKITWGKDSGGVYADIRFNDDVHHDDNREPIDWEGKEITFHADRVLNFHPDRKITGINIIDGMIFWTDNYSEPKKIDIERCKLGSKYFVGNSESDESWIYKYYHFDQHTRLITNVNPLTGEGEEPQECSKDDVVCPTAGCTDSTAHNFDPNADVPCDSGGGANDCCCYILGCMDPMSYNYNPNACMSDPNDPCVPVITGCMDPNACNYDPSANIACGDETTLGPNGGGPFTSPTWSHAPCEGSQTILTDPQGCCCQRSAGCMDTNAMNFVVEANCDDGSCVYCTDTTPYCTINDVGDDSGICTASPNGDGRFDLTIHPLLALPPTVGGQHGDITVYIMSGPNCMDPVSGALDPSCTNYVNYTFSSYDPLPLIWQYGTLGNVNSGLVPGNYYVYAIMNAVGPGQLDGPHATIDYTVDDGNGNNHVPFNGPCPYGLLTSFQVGCTPSYYSCVDPNACNYDDTIGVTGYIEECVYDCLSCEPGAPCVSCNWDLNKNLILDPHFWHIWSPEYMSGRFFSGSMSGTDSGSQYTGLNNSCGQNPNPVHPAPQMVTVGVATWVNSSGLASMEEPLVGSGGLSSRNRVWRGIECTINKAATPTGAINIGEWYSWTDQHCSSEYMIDPRVYADYTTWDAALNRFDGLTYGDQTFLPGGMVTTTNFGNPRVVADPIYPPENYTLDVNGDSTSPNPSYTPGMAPDDYVPLETPIEFKFPRSGGTPANPTLRGNKSGQTGLECLASDTAAGIFQFVPTPSYVGGPSGAQEDWSDTFEPNETYQLSVEYELGFRRENYRDYDSGNPSIIDAGEYGQACQEYSPMGNGCESFRPTDHSCTYGTNAGCDGQNGCVWISHSPVYMYVGLGSLDVASSHTVQWPHQVVHIPKITIDDYEWGVYGPTLAATPPAIYDKIKITDVWMRHYVPWPTTMPIEYHGSLISVNTTYTPPREYTDQYINNTGTPAQTIFTDPNGYEVWMDELGGSNGMVPLAKLCEGEPRFSQNITHHAEPNPYTAVPLYSGSNASEYALLGNIRYYWHTVQGTAKYDFVWPDQQRYNYNKKDASGTPVQGTNPNTGNVQDIYNIEEILVNHDLLTLSFFQDGEGGVAVTRSLVNNFTNSSIDGSQSGGKRGEHKNIYLWVKSVCVQKCPDGDCGTINTSPSIS